MLLLPPTIKKSWGGNWVAGVVAGVAGVVAGVAGVVTGVVAGVAGVVTGVVTNSARG
jgi:hypothetical protein